MPTLFIVGTPIGNLEDISRRALRVLQEAPLIAAEDTRVARKLLAAYGLRGRLVAYNATNGRRRMPVLLEALQRHDVAFVTDAGMPAISDPGAQLVGAAAAAGVAVQIVPGPSALTTALAAAGLPVHQFLFLGFPPSRSGPRRRLLANAAALPYALVLFEAPHRLRATLADLADTVGSRQLAVCRELTKLFEEVFRGTAEQALAYYPEPKGEFTLVVLGPEQRAAPKEERKDVEGVAQRELLRLRQTGVLPKEAVTEVARRWRLPRRQVYEWWTQLP